MHTWLFWGGAAMAVVSALAVVAQANPLRALAIMPLPLAVGGGLCLLLSAPVVAAALALTALGCALGGRWARAHLGSHDERAGVVDVVSVSGARRTGVALVVVLILELAWVFRGVRGAALNTVQTAPGDLVALGRTAVAEHAAAGLLVALLAVAVLAGAAALVRRDVS